MWNPGVLDTSASQKAGANPLYLTPLILKGHFEQHPKSSWASPVCCLVVGVRAQNPVKQQVSLMWPPPSWLLLAALSPQEHHQKSTWELIWASYELSPCLLCVKSTQEGLRAIMKGVRVTIRDDEGF